MLQNLGVFNSFSLFLSWLKTTGVERGNSRSGDQETVSPIPSGIQTVPMRIMLFIWVGVGIKVPNGYQMTP